MSLSLRMAEPADSAAVAAIYAPAVRESVVSFEERPPSSEEMAERIARTVAKHPWLVAERDGAVIGYAYGGTHRARAAYRWSVETSAYVHADVRRQGVARALYEALFDLLALQGYVEAFAGITLPNEASVGLHEAMGFTPVGVYHRVGFKRGAWHDVGWWQRPLRSPPTVPSDPRAPAKLSSTDEWTWALRERLPGR